jgi:alkanesulfonate monooxygenase SsuD/methylene tetrahydromethanopterin reductase-like flavin-dependent oxidoreductase (luciferase family)
MNPDQQLIQSAYDDAIKRLYATLFDGYATAGGVPEQERQVDQNFAAGVSAARRSRDRAIALLAQTQTA